MRYLLGDFSPSLDSTTPNIIVDSNWVYRTMGGWAAMAPMMLINAASLPSQAYGALGVPIVSGTYEIVAGTTNQLYKLNASNAFVSQGLTLVGGTNPWSFTVYGNDLLATNGIDPVQVSTSGGVFAALGGSPPIFAIVEASDFSLFGILANSNVGYFTFNDTLWTPNIATLTGTFSLTSTPGNITAAKQLRGGIAVYKESSAFFGQYTAVPSQLWQFTNSSKTVGSRSMNGVVPANNLHYIMGPDNFYMFDGFTMTEIPSSLRNWFFNTQLYQPLSNLVRGIYDFVNNQVMWWYPKDSTGALNNYISLSLSTGMWCVGELGVDAPVNLVPSPSTFQTQFGANSSLAAILSSHSLGVSGPTAAGTTYASGAPFITSGDLGDKRNVFRLTRVKPGLLNYPQVGNAQNSNTPPANTPVIAPKLDVLGTYVPGQSYNTMKSALDISTRGFFDFKSANTLQRLKFKMSTGYEIADAEIEIELQGSQ